jgi:hypothetical protein
MLLKLLNIRASHKKDKKLDAVFEIDKEGHKKEKIVSFGAKGMSDYTKHHDEERKERYLKRHQSAEDWNNPTSAGALSRYILWNKGTIKESIKDFKNKFKL